MCTQRTPTKLQIYSYVLDLTRTAVWAPLPVTPVYQPGDMYKTKKQHEGEFNGCFCAGWVNEDKCLFFKSVFNLQNKKVVRRFGEFVSYLPVIVTAFEGILAYGTETSYMLLHFITEMPIKPCLCLLCCNEVIIQTKTWLNMHKRTYMKNAWKNFVVVIVLHHD